MPNDLIAIRQSHLLGHNGVGAIVRGPSGMMVVQDIRQWTDRHGEAGAPLIPYVERVRAVLGIQQQLRKPPIARELSSGVVDGVCVPASRFPAWARCPTCGALSHRPWLHDQPDYEPICREEQCKKARLEQVTWVLADPAGYLADVPWHFLAHRDARNPAQSQCKVYDQLRLLERGNELRELRCDACGVRRRFDGDERPGFGSGRRMQPWTTNDLVPPSEATEGENKPVAQIVAVNDSRVYSPHVKTVLVIPPESRVRKGTVVDHLYRNSAERARIDGARNALARKTVIKTLAAEYRCNPEDIQTALDDLNRGYPLYGDEPTQGQLRESEFNAFLETLPDQRDDEDLVTRNLTNQWLELCRSSDKPDLHTNIVGITNLVRVDRLKAVKVFTGFSRLGEENIVPPDIVGQSNWLPAIELYGEGLFITLDESKLARWEQHPGVSRRLSQLLPRFAQAGRDSPNPLSARFLLLHTLSHLLMRQIESDGGYPAASLNERLYCANEPEPMAGILIYVAVPDIAGSLGGLAELAETTRFLGILTRALEHSRWCSLDPVCSEHEGQGPGLLNRAACHACALVPEPACEYGNSLLDRGFVKGEEDHDLPSYFKLP